MPTPAQNAESVMMAEDVERRRAANTRLQFAAVQALARQRAVEQRVAAFQAYAANQQQDQAQMPWGKYALSGAGLLLAGVLFAKATE